MGILQEERGVVMNGNKKSYGFDTGKRYIGPWRSSDTKTTKEQEKAYRKAQKASERRKNNVKLEDND